MLLKVREAANNDFSQNFLSHTVSVFISIIAVTCAEEGAGHLKRPSTELSEERCWEDQRGVKIDEEDKASKLIRCI